ncbi:MAG: multidrug effflux MFS transporter [Proteobacteria bacterium]|nr:multidrug effflux MFS transporter [Pseudomonadota bacterium]
MSSAYQAPTRGSAYLGLAALLAGLSMVSPFSIDTFFPAFKAMEREFGVADWQMQQTLTAYMLPYAFSAVFFGPLADAIGRRPVILWGLSVYTLGSLACVLTSSFGSLLAFRAVQGATAGVGMVVGRAIVRDLYHGPQAQRLMSLISLLFGVAPAIAPVVGGWIHVALGWRAVFGFMALLGVTLVVTSALKLPETHPPQRRVEFSVRTLTTISLRVIRDREFLLLAFAASLMFAGVFCFIGSAPTIVLDHWGLDETQFIWLFLPVVAGFTVGAALSGRLAGRIAPMRQAAIGFAIAALACSVRLLLHWQFSPLPIAVQQGLLFLTGIATQLVFPVLTLRMLDLFPEARGAAASMQTFVSLLVASATIGLLVPLVQKNLTSLAMLSACSVWLALILWRLACHRAAGEAGRVDVVERH